MEPERANDPTIHTNADGVVFIDTAVKHVESEVTERCTRTQHGQQSRKWLEELTSLQAEKDPELVEIQVAQLIWRERSRSVQHAVKHGQKGVISVQTALDSNVFNVIKCVAH